MSAPSSPRIAVAPWPALAALAIVVAGFAAYSNTFSVPFLLDDTVSILENASIRQLSSLGDVLAPPANAGVGGRPLANFSFAVNYAFSGTSVRGYHLANLALHLASALALFGLVRRTLAARVLAPRFSAAARTPLALAVALLWVLHPLQTEAVTYISQRTELLMALCYLLTLFAFVRGAEASSRGWLAAAVVACGCGMASKEVMVTAPVVVFLFDRTFVAGSFRDAWVQRRWFYLALAATWLVLAFELSGVTQRGVTYEKMTWWQYAFTECSALLHYLRLAIWPTPLVFDYGTDIAPSPGGAFLPAVAILVLVAAVALALWRWPVLGFAGASFFVLLAPTSSIVPIAGQPMAEHRMYLPLAGLIATAVLAAQARFGRKTFFVFGALALLGGFFTHRRNVHYQSAASLWRDTIAKCPTSSRAHAALGEAWLQEKKNPEAIAEIETALRLDPNDAKAHNNLAVALGDSGRTVDAIAHYRASARLEPKVASTFYNLGNALLETGQPAEAITALERALALQPEFAVAHAALANALVAAGRAPDAIAHFTEALRLDPALAPAHFALANLLATTGRLSEALPHYEATVRALPNAPEAHFNFAAVLAATGRTDEAIAHFATALQLKPDFTAARENLERLRAANP